MLCPYVEIGNESGFSLDRANRSGGDTMFSEWISFIDIWWNSIGIALQIFYSIGLLSSLVLLIQVALMVFGFGMDMDDPSAGHVTDASDGLHLLSVRTLTAFFMGFGWTGVIAVKQHVELEIAISIALLIGMFFMLIIFFLLRMLYDLRDCGNLDYRNAIGKIGVVYIPIPPLQSGAGQVEVTLQGRLSFVPAYTTSNHKIISQTRVKIIDLIDPQTILVEPLSERHETVTNNKTPDDKPGQ